MLRLCKDGDVGLFEELFGLLFGCCLLLFFRSCWINSDCRVLLLEVLSVGRRSVVILFLVAPPYHSTYGAYSLHTRFLVVDSFFPSNQTFFEDIESRIESIAQFESFGCRLFHTGGSIKVIVEEILIKQVDEVEKL